MVKFISWILQQVQLRQRRLININIIKLIQRAKKVVSDSPGLVDFAIGLVNSVFNLTFFEEFK